MMDFVYLTQGVVQRNTCRRHDIAEGTHALQRGCDATIVHRWHTRAAIISMHAFHLYTLIAHAALDPFRMPSSLYPHLLLVFTQSTMFELHTRRIIVTDSAWDQMIHG